jgi:acyl-CoA hydrolase
VCSFQHSEVVTEQGIAAISGQSQRTQARRLIDEASHPRARDELRRAAHSLGLAPLAV